MRLALLLVRASMGPRSENRGYARAGRVHLRTRLGFNGSTVREPWLFVLAVWPIWRCSRFNGSTVREPWLSLCTYQNQPRERRASMGPRSENRGYSTRGLTPFARNVASMGPRSENRGYGQCDCDDGCGYITASMGPRSENRGYFLSSSSSSVAFFGRFNGSTVREPWL